MRVTTAMRALRFIAAMAALIAFAAAAENAIAQTPITNDSILEERTKELSAHLRCPVCQGLSIQDSPSELSQEMKSVVREQLRAGKTPEEIKAYFVSKYGEWILLEPKPAGMNMIAYLAPLFFLLGGGALIVVMVRKWSSA